MTSQTALAKQPENPMSEFERRIREILLLTPTMPLRTAVTLAERTGEPIDYPADPSDANAVAMWASQFAEVMNFMAERRHIDAIAAMRRLSPAGENGQRLGLKHAKDAMEILRNS